MIDPQGPQVLLVMIDVWFLFAAAQIIVKMKSLDVIGNDSPVKQGLP
jgi:hypothetical protein